MENDAKTIMDWQLVFAALFWRFRDSNNA